MGTKVTNICTQEFRKENYQVVIYITLLAEKLYSKVLLRIQEMLFKRTLERENKKEKWIGGRGVAGFAQTIRVKEPWAI